MVVYPLDFARTRLAVDVGTKGTREFTGAFDVILKVRNPMCISHLVASKGILHIAFRLCDLLAGVEVVCITDS